MKKVLIVDDEEAILLTLRRAFANSETEVILARKIEQAEYAVKNANIDLVVADIRLTGVLGREGLELLDYVKEKSPGTKVIIMTGYGSPELEKESYDKGAWCYFEKPLDLRLLLECTASAGIYGLNKRAS